MIDVFQIIDFRSCSVCLLCSVLEEYVFSPLRPPASYSENRMIEAIKDPDLLDPLAS